MVYYIVYSIKEDPRKFFFIKKFYLGVAFLMIHNQMSHTQPKNLVLSLIYRAAIDFKKSKKNWKHRGPVLFECQKIFFKEHKTSLTEYIKSTFLFNFCFFSLNRSASELYDLADVYDPGSWIPDCNYKIISRKSKSC